jgi:hypothetical protein
MDSDEEDDDSDDDDDATVFQMVWQCKTFLT